MNITVSFVSLLYKLAQKLQVIIHKMISPNRDEASQQLFATQQQPLLSVPEEDQNIVKGEIKSISIYRGKRISSSPAGSENLKLFLKIIVTSDPARTSPWVTLRETGELTG